MMTLSSFSSTLRIFLPKLILFGGMRLSNRSYSSGRANNCPLYPALIEDDRKKGREEKDGENEREGEKEWEREKGRERGIDSVL